MGVSPRRGRTPEEREDGRSPRARAKDDLVALIGLALALCAAPLAPAETESGCRRAQPLMSAHRIASHDLDFLEEHLTKCSACCAALWRATPA